MRLGWKVLIPVTIVWIVVEGVMAYLKVGPWKRGLNYAQHSQDIPAERVAQRPVRDLEDTL